MEVYTQVFSLIVTVGIGMLLSSIFDFCRAARGLFRLNRAMTALLDGVYWLVAVIVTFACLLYSNWAQMRFYIFLGMIGGAVFYYKFISQYMLMMFFRSFHFFITMQKKIRAAACYIVKPLGYFLGILSFPFRYGKQKAGKMGRKMKNKLILHKNMTKK